MVGSASGTSHRLGDQVTVRLVEAAPVAGALRFELLSEARPRHGQARRPAPGRKMDHRKRQERPQGAKRAPLTAERNRQ